MKRYKLKKDLPTVRAGEVFVRKTNETAQTDMLYHVDSEDVFLPPSIEVDDIINFDEWFEEVKEFEEWKPEEGEDFIYLDCCGELCCQKYSSYDDVSHHTTSVGNCYPFGTPDELIIKEQKLIPQAMHRLKMAAKKAWFEFNRSDSSDWKNGDQSKFLIVHDSLGIRSYQTFWVRDLGQVYFPTKKSCQAYIDNNPEDIKLLFGVE